MKVEYPNDLDGRISKCAARAKLIADSLQAIAHSDLQEPDKETLYDFGALAEELADELLALRNTWVDKSNAEYERLKAAGLES